MRKTLSIIALFFTMGYTSFTRAADLGNPNQVIQEQNVENQVLHHTTNPDQGDSKCRAEQQSTSVIKVEEVSQDPMHYKQLPGYFEDGSILLDSPAWQARQSARKPMSISVSVEWWTFNPYKCDDSRTVTLTNDIYDVTRLDMIRLLAKKKIKGCENRKCPNSSLVNRTICSECTFKKAVGINYCNPEPEYLSPFVIHINGATEPLPDTMTVGEAVEKDLDLVVSNYPTRYKIWVRTGTIKNDKADGKEKDKKPLAPSTEIALLLHGIYS